MSKRNKATHLRHAEKKFIVFSEEEDEIKTQQQVSRSIILLMRLCVRVSMCLALNHLWKYVDSASSEFHISRKKIKILTKLFFHATFAIAELKMEFYNVCKVCDEWEKYMKILALNTQVCYLFATWCSKERNFWGGNEKEGKIWL